MPPVDNFSQIWYKNGTFFENMISCQITMCTFRFYNFSFATGLSQTKTIDYTAILGDACS